MRKGIFAFLVISLILASLSGCSSKNAECKVTLDRKGNLDIIVNPPGENGQVEQEGGLKRASRISSGSKETTYTGTIEKTYAESGNTYDIEVYIEIDNDRLVDYELKVTGGVYGDTPHTCQK